MRPYETARLINLNLTELFGDEAFDEEHQEAVCDAVLKRCLELQEAGDPLVTKSPSVVEFIQKMTGKTTPQTPRPKGVAPKPVEVPQGISSMSPQQAEAWLVAIEKDVDHPYHRATDPRHEEWTKIVNELQGRAYPFGSSWSSSRISEPGTGEGVIE